MEDTTMKKIILAVLLIALMAFTLAGCKSQDITDDTGKKVGDIKVTKNDDGSKTMTAHIETTDHVGEGEACSWDGDCSGMTKCLKGKCTPVQCKFLSDCKESDVICFQGQCMEEPALFARFDQWKLNERCQGACDTCKSGEFKSTMSSGRDQEYRICTHCMDDKDCADGAWCDVGKCVRDGGSSEPAAKTEDDEPAFNPQAAEPEGEFRVGSVVFIDNDDDGWWTAAKIESLSGTNAIVVFDPIDEEHSLRSSYDTSMMIASDIDPVEKIRAYKGRDFDSYEYGFIESRDGENVHIRYKSGEEEDADIYIVEVNRG